MTAVARIDHISGRAMAIRGNDIDTDRIMPARFLKAVTFAGIERHLFEDDRRALAARDATHPLDRPAHIGASILLVNANFGCGSSREHAPQGLLRWGLRAVIAESCAEIFFSNAVAIGLACVAASRADVERLMAIVESTPETVVAVDLRDGVVTAADLRIAVSMPAEARAALLSGAWDATSLLLERYDEVERTAARLRY
jgi:3-isopropylmalate/(R)-2-methylmalate dehydratase small subunit